MMPPVEQQVPGGAALSTSRVALGLVLECVRSSFAHAHTH